MRLLIIGLNFAPEPIGVGKYTGEMAAWFATRGHDVSVITTRPYYPEWQRLSGLHRWTWQTEKWKNCQVIRCPIYVPKRLSGARRLLHLGSFAISIIPGLVVCLMKKKVEVIATVSPTLLSAPITLVAARLLNARTWLHIQDLELDAAFRLGFIRGRYFVHIARKFERWILRRFDMVSTISPKMLDIIESKGVPRSRLMLFPNWVDTNHFFPLPRSNTMRQDLGISNDRCVVMYAGSMGTKQGLEHIIDIARQLSATPEKSPLFVFAGAGPARHDLECSAKDLPNVKFVSLLPEDKFNEFLNMGDIHLLPQRADAADLVMPSKLGAILAAGKPVIATVPQDSQVAHTLRNAGIIVPPENPQMLVDAIRKLMADVAQRRVLGAAALQVARSTMQADIILNHTLEQLVALAAR